jgi:PAS domain S-box-containing protein
MRVRWGWRTPGASREAVPLTSSSFRLLIAGAVGVLIWLIWATGMLGNTQRVTMLALSAVSILGLGLVIELRRVSLAEQAARESEHRYRLLADHSFDMIVRFDPRTQRRTYVSPACRHLYGYEPEEAMALSAEEIIHPDDLPAVREALASLKADPNHPPILYRGRRKDGTYIWVEASLTPLTDPESGDTEIVSVVRDVGERIRYEAALGQAKEEADSANRSKSQFLATMSHELRTPLNAIIGFADMMQNEIMGPIGNEKYRSYSADIHASGEHLLQIINDILDLTKAEAGMLELHEEVVDLTDVIGSVACLSSGSIKNGGLTIKIDLPASLPLLRADERKTRQILFNLIGNAVKFTPAGGHIEVAGRFGPQSGISITVADTGIGIAAADLPRVLIPFVQVDSQISRQYDGTGLGLPTAKALIELHGGVLELKSTPGLGTEATFIFPPGRVLDGEGSPPARRAA